MEMGQDTYRHSASAGFPLGVTMVTYPISLPAYLPAFSTLTTQPSSRATGFAPERIGATPVRKNAEHALSCFTAERGNVKLWPCLMLLLLLTVTLI